MKCALSIQLSTLHSDLAFEGRCHGRRCTRLDQLTQLAAATVKQAVWRRGFDRQCLTLPSDATPCVPAPAAPFLGLQCSRLNHTVCTVTISQHVVFLERFHFLVPISG
ncbi:hypothetical protein L1887_57074 [Cichorium endivia]|nr:hypothetical protein L1887_57074 [Cichorium endivia]